MFEKGGELVRANYTSEKFAVFEENKNFGTYLYLDCLCVPRSLRFSSGWVYVHSVAYLGILLGGGRGSTNSV